MRELMGAPGAEGLSSLRNGGAEGLRIGGLSGFNGLRGLRDLTSAVTLRAAVKGAESMRRRKRKGRAICLRAEGAEGRRAEKLRS